MEKEKLTNLSSLYDDNLETTLINNGFQLYTFYETNKLFRKEINECENLYVRIYSNVNEIVDVEYENIAMTKFEESGRVNFENITTIDKLFKFMDAVS